MSNLNPDITDSTASQLVATQDAPGDWKGMTLDELRRARGKALVKREVGRASLGNDLEDVKSNVATNGVRALMFNRNTMSHLKTADYVLLGFRLARWISGTFGKRRRRY